MTVFIFSVSAQNPIFAVFQRHTGERLKFSLKQHHWVITKVTNLCYCLRSQTNMNNKKTARRGREERREMKIDLVDDEPILRELYKTVIKSSGFDVNCFADAEDYISYTNSNEYTPPNIALITDVCMPGKSGYELIDEIRKINPKQKVVVLTGTPHKGANNKTRACFYLQKPVSTKKLMAVIELLSACASAGNTDLASECKLQSDLDSFGIHDWQCPLRGDSILAKER